MKKNWLNVIASVGASLIGAGFVGMMLAILYKVITVVNSSDDHWTLLILGWLVVFGMLLFIIVVVIVFILWLYGIFKWLFVETHQKHD